MRKLKVGLIGAGGFGQQHLQGYKRNENCELLAIASRTEEHVKEIAKKFAIPHVYWGDDWKKMLKEENLDILSICTPNYLHAPITLEAIKNDINILCEKPICITTKELREVEENLKSKKLIYFTSFQKRYNPLFLHVKEIIEEKLLGKLISARYLFAHLGPYTSWRALSKQRWFFDSALAGGGVALDLGVHSIDILRYLIGEISKVEGYSANTSCKDIKNEDNCTILTRFKNDCLGTISISWCNQPMETIDILGTEGTLSIDLNSNTPITCIPRKLKKNSIIKDTLSYTPTNENTQFLLINHFVDCVLKGTQEHPNFEDGKRAVEIVLEAYGLK